MQLSKKAAATTLLLLDEFAETVNNIDYQTINELKNFINKNVIETSEQKAIALRRKALSKLTEREIRLLGIKL